MTGYVLLRNTYDVSFNEKSNQRDWVKVGAAVMVNTKGEARVTRECLLSDEVRRECGDSANDQNQISLRKLTG